MASQLLTLCTVRSFSGTVERDAVTPEGSRAAHPGIRRLWIRGQNSSRPKSVGHQLLGATRDLASYSR